MAKFKFNIFFVISIVCIFLLIGYLWFFFLPTFEGALEYDTIKNVTMIITAILVISAVLTFLQMMVSE